MSTRLHGVTQNNIPYSHRHQTLILLYRVYMFNLFPSILPFYIQLLFFSEQTVLLLEYLQVSYLCRCCEHVLSLQLLATRRPCHQYDKLSRL